MARSHVPIAIATRVVTVETMTSPLAERPARIAVVYYSARGNVHGLARAAAEGAASEGVEVRLRHVAELNQELLISAKQHWGQHRSEIEDEPDARLEDIEWADGIAFGTPTRFGNVSAQLKLFLDLAGELWQQGRLVDKVATAFTSSQTEHGGQESTILALNNTLYHWGAIIVPLGYTVHEVFNGGGNPYGASFTSDHHTGGPDKDTLVVARAQGARLARVAKVIGAARDAGLLTTKPARATLRSAPQVGRGSAPMRPIGSTRSSSSKARAEALERFRASGPRLGNKTSEDKGDSCARLGGCRGR